MIHVVIGVIALAVAAWGIRANWWAFQELVFITISLYLIFRGSVAIAKGLSAIFRARKTEAPLDHK